MADQQLFDYIKQSFAVGNSEEQIRSALLGSGWRSEDIDRALSEMKRPPSKTTKKIIFAVLILVLAAAAGAAYFFVNKQKAGKEPGDSGQFYTGLPPVRTNKIVIIVDSRTNEEIRPEIERFREDVANDLSSNVAVVSGNYRFPAEVKNALRKEKEQGDFDGAIFVGDIPLQFLRIKSGEQFLGAGISDTWYLDFENDIYVEKKAEKQCLSSHFCIEDYIEVDGNALAKPLARWSGRLLPPLDEQNRIALLETYFDRNHAYRTGLLKYEGALIFAPDSALNTSTNACKTQEACVSRAENVFVKHGVADKKNLEVIVAFSDADKTKDNYLVSQGKPHAYEMVHAHGNPVSFGQPNEKIYFDDLVQHRSGALFTNLLSCNVGLVGAEKNIANAYLYHGNTLAVYAAGIEIEAWSPFSETVESKEIPLLGRGGTLFEALDNENFRFIFGDPTLRITKPKESGCQLGFDQTSLPFGDIHISGSDILNKSDAVTALRIMNVGTETCALDSIYTSGIGTNLDFYENPKDLDLRKPDQIKVGEVVKVIVTIHPSLYEIKDERPVISERGTINFVTNDGQYLKSLPIMVNFVKN